MVVVVAVVCSVFCYYSANEEWQSRDILFTIAEFIYSTMLRIKYQLVYFTLEDTVV